MPSRWHAPDDDTIAWFQNNDSQTFTRRNIATDALEAAGSIAERFPNHPQFQSDVAITDRRLTQLRAKLD